jgi:hypothetical protein
MPSTCPSIAVSVSQQPHYPSVVVPEATAAIPEEHTAPSRIFSAGSLKPLGHKFEDGVLKVLYDEEDLKRWKAEKGIVEHVRDEGKDKHAGLGAGGNEQADGGVVLLPVSTGGHEPLTTNSHNNAVAHTEDEQEDDTVKHSGTGLTVTPVVLPAQSSLRSSAADNNDSMLNVQGELKEANSLLRSLQGGSSSREIDDGRHDNEIKTLGQVVEMERKLGLGLGKTISIPIPTFEGVAEAKSGMKQIVQRHPAAHISDRQHGPHVYHQAPTQPYVYSPGQQDRSSHRSPSNQTIGPPLDQMSYAERDNQIDRNQQRPRTQPPSHQQYRPRMYQPTQYTHQQRWQQHGQQQHPEARTSSVGMQGRPSAGGFSPNSPLSIEQQNVVDQFQADRQRLDSTDQPVSSGRIMDGPNGTNQGVQRYSEGGRAEQYRETNRTGNGSRGEHGMRGSESRTSEGGSWMRGNGRSGPWVPRRSEVNGRRVASGGEEVGETPNTDMGRRASMQEDAREWSR